MNKNNNDIEKLYKTLLNLPIDRKDSCIKYYCNKTGDSFYNIRERIKYYEKRRRIRNRVN